MEKPHVFVTVLCGRERHGWINPALSSALIAMSHDPRFALTIEHTADVQPVDYARNHCIDKARKANADWLVSFDNDVIPHSNPLDILAEATPDTEIIGLTYGVSLDNGHTYKLATEQAEGTQQGRFLPVTFIAGGTMMIRRSIWDKTAGPWFCWLTGQDELRSPIGGCGEDVYFSKKMRAAGLTLWTHPQLVGHLKTTDVTALALPK